MLRLNLIIALVVLIAAGSSLYAQDAKIKMPKVAWQAGEVAALVARLQTLKVQPAK
jgi:hypothetical protein